MDQLPESVGSADGPVLKLFPSGSSPGSAGVPLRFVVRGSDYYVVAPGRKTPGWARALGTSPLVEWTVEGRILSGVATPASHDSARVFDVLEELEARHGSDRVRRWFGSQAIVFRLHPGSAPGPDAPGSIERHFDALAPVYDHIVAANPMDRALREEALHVLLRAFQPGDRVLELGCGTGLETIPLARAGIRVVGVDLSQGMLDGLRVKAAAEELSDLIETRKMRAADVGRLVEEYGTASFHGAFSNFGPPNLEEDWSRVPEALAALVRPSGTVVLTVWNRVCLTEMTLYALGLRPRRALARLRSPVPVGLSRFGLPAYAYSPGSFLRPFRRHFDVERVIGLPAVVPPYDFLPHMPRPDRILPLLASIDRAVAGRFPLNRLGDHFLAILRRR